MLRGQVARGHRRNPTKRVGENRGDTARTSYKAKPGGLKDLYLTEGTSLDMRELGAKTAARRADDRYLAWISTQHI
jgi:hypothetical protein